MDSLPQPHEEPSPLESVRHWQRRISRDEQYPTKLSEENVVLEERIADLEKEINQTTYSLELAGFELASIHERTLECIKAADDLAEKKIKVEEHKVKTAVNVAGEKVKSINTEARRKVEVYEFSTKVGGETPRDPTWGEG